MCEFFGRKFAQERDLLYFLDTGKAIFKIYWAISDRVVNV